MWPGRNRVTPTCILLYKVEGTRKGGNPLQFNQQTTSMLQNVNTKTTYNEHYANFKGHPGSNTRSGNAGVSDTCFEGQARAQIIIHQHIRRTLKSFGLTDLYCPPHIAFTSQANSIATTPCLPKGFTLQKIKKVCIMTSRCFANQPLILQPRNWLD